MDSCSTGAASHHHLPACSRGSTGSGMPPAAAAAAAGRADAGPILVSKVLTYSDVSTDVARTGRIVLPRIQVQGCLAEVLRLCRAEAALPALRSGGPVKLSVDLAIEDEAGRGWVLLMKTWQNVVSGEHRPTFVLENTADFVRANRLSQGDTLALCPTADGRMLLRTSLRADQLPPRQLKRGGGAAAAAGGAPAAKRRAPARHAAPPPQAAWDAAPPSAFAAAVAAAAGRKGKQLAEPGTPDTSPFWHPQACRAEEAAQALLEMHSGSSLESSLSEQLPLTSRGASPDRDPAAAAAPPPRRGGAQPAFPAPAPAAAAVPYPVYRPTPVHGAMDPTAGLLAPWFVAPAAAAPVAPALPLLPPAPRLRGGCPPPAAACGAGVDAGVLAQAHRWLASVLAQQEQERRYLEQYNHLLLLQAMQQEQARRRQQHTQRCTPAAAAMAGHCAGPLLA